MHGLVFLHVKSPPPVCPGAQASTPGPCMSLTKAANLPTRKAKRLPLHHLPAHVSRPLASPSIHPSIRPSIPTLRPVLIQPVIPSRRFSQALGTPRLPPLISTRLGARRGHSFQAAGTSFVLGALGYLSTPVLPVFYTLPCRTDHHASRPVGTPTIGLGGPGIGTHLDTQPRYCAGQLLRLQQRLPLSQSLASRVPWSPGFHTRSPSPVIALAACPPTGPLGSLYYLTKIWIRPRHRPGQSSPASSSTSNMNTPSKPSTCPPSGPSSPKT